MSYFSIKTIKGHRYLYRQEGHREGPGGKVRTHSDYIGPLCESNAYLVTSSKKHSGEGAERATDASAERAEGKESPQGSGFTSKVDLNGLKISEGALRTHQDIFNRHMARKGVDMSKVSSVVIKHGSKVGHQRNIFGRQMVVTLPKTGINRGAFRREFFKAQGRLAIEAFRDQQPENFLKLSQRFDTSFRKSQRLISGYIMGARGRFAIARGIALRYWGNAAQLQKHIPHPDKLGMYDYSARKSWQDEAVSIYAEMQQKGKEQFRKNASAKWAMAKRELETAEAERKKLFVLDPKRIKAKKRIKRARARFENMCELGEKVKIVSELFG